MKKKSKCPHGKIVPVVSLQVCKLGDWKSQGPYALFVDVYKGGSLEIAQGTKKEMNAMLEVAKARLVDEWQPAQLVSRILTGVIP